MREAHSESQSERAAVAVRGGDVVASPRPCPVCGTKVQRIIYAENETNYCPRCQTQGKVLADRSMSRLLKDDWPRSVEELEDWKGRPAV